jgi:hypothetical protein
VRIVSRPSYEDLLPHPQTHMCAVTGHLKEVEMDLLFGNHLGGIWKIQVVLRTTGFCRTEINCDDIVAGQNLCIYKV